MHCPIDIIILTADHEFAVIFFKKLQQTFQASNSIKRLRLFDFDKLSIAYVCKITKIIFGV